MRDAGAQEVQSRIFSEQVEKRSWMFGDSPAPPSVHSVHKSSYLSVLAIYRVNRLRHKSQSFRERAS